MPHSKQARKRMRQSEERRLRNKSMKSSVKTAIKRATGATDPGQARAFLAEAMRRIDKAAKSHVLHKNAAGRLKSRVTRKLRVGAAAPGKAG
jgi:small subunit ribosomal protein S20